MTPIDDLFAEIFEGKRGPLYAEFAEWLRASRRFQAFATEYRTKIRAKLRNAQDAEGVKDVRAELEAAARLLREKSLALEYEKYAASGSRGPDFTVTFKTHTLFNVEVRRMRGAEFDPADPNAVITKLVAAICDKVGQMPPGVLNFLWLTSESDISQLQLAAAGLLLRRIYEEKADAFFVGRGFVDAADFLKQYQRLAGIIVPKGETAIWFNPFARHTPSPELVKALRRVASEKTENG